MAVDSVLMPLDECLVVDVKELHELGGSHPCDERTLREDHLIILDGLLHERRFDCVAERIMERNGVHQERPGSCIAHNYLVRDAHL